MNATTLPRLLVAVLTLVLAATGLTMVPVAAANGIDWSQTTSRENVLVQDCHGPDNVQGFSPTLAFGFDFAITTSYTTHNAYHVFEDFTGINHQVMESRHVSFTGTVANATTGRSLAYDGRLTRTAGADQEAVTITDLVLHLAPSDRDDVTVTVDRDNSGLIDNPETMLLAYAPRGLHTSLCGFFAGLKIVG
jgi:hypothetical protein